MLPETRGEAETRHLILTRDGSVRIRDTTALGKRSDGITPSLVDYFGDGLAKTTP